MISITQYRCAVGRFYLIAHKSSTRGLMNKSMTANELFDFITHFRHQYLLYLKINFLKIFGILDDLYKTIIDWAFLMILLCNDVETHPGPLFEKAISGSFDQSHPKFGINRGKQCASIALYSVAFSSIKRVERWTKENLDSLLEFGNDFYTSLNIPRYLGSEDLPKRVPILQHGVNIDYTFNTYGILSASEEHIQQLNKFISDNIENNTGFLM